VGKGKKDRNKKEPQGLTDGCMAVAITNCGELKEVQRCSVRMGRRRGTVEEEVIGFVWGGTEPGKKNWKIREYQRGKRQESRALVICEF